jgi:hypothetical protein
MLKLPLVLAAIAVTVLCWGNYGILLHEGQDRMESGLRPFVGVGLAYFLIAVVVPILWMTSRVEKGHWSLFGSLLSFAAGAVGALGALGIILALSNGGQAIYVMPLVFGGAPVVNTLVTTALTGTYRNIKPIFVAGLLLVILGTAGVLSQRPRGGPAATLAEGSDVAQAVQSELGEIESAGEPTNDELPGADGESSDSDAADSDAADSDAGDGQVAADASSSNDGGEKAAARMNRPTGDNMALAESGPASASPGKPPAKPWPIMLSILMAIVCWGSYGPFLHLGQMRMGGSRMRPFTCVGLAYFFIAVAVPLAILTAAPDSGRWDAPGLLWSIIAGAAGAIGALGIIFAFNFGGKPVFVMPLVFGFAPVMNTLVSMSLSGTLDQAPLLFLISIAVTIAGAVTVLIFAPTKGAPHSPAAAAK